MSAAVVICSFVLLHVTAFAQDLAKAPAFEVASVKPSQRLLGPDANNRFAFAPAAFTARNATLRRLAAEAYRLQVSQVRGPVWLDRSEYDIEAKADSPATRDQLRLMLRTLLAERFKLTQHRDAKETRLYELVTDKAGLKIHAAKEGETPAMAPGFRFHGDMRQFADLLAVQLSIAISSDPAQPGRAAGSPVPVLDKTGLSGVYDFRIEIKPEPGSDMFTLWQRVLQDKLGLRLNSRRGEVDI